MSILEGIRAESAARDRAAYLSGKPRFEPYGGAGPLPTDCCEFAVVDNSTGKEICRVWEEEHARKIASLLETNRDS